MPFNLVHLSQQDPKWKNTQLGHSNLTIGEYGCALTCVAMYLSGFNYSQDVASLNAKMKNVGGFIDAAILWGAVSSLYSKIKYKNLILCRDTDAPIDMIGDSVRAGQPVLLEVDSSPKSGLQTHWVVAYEKVGKDFLVLDPFPYPSDSEDVSLMARYSQGKTLKRSITAAVFYECQGEGVLAAPTPTDGGYYVRVFASLEAGLRLRSKPTTASDTITIEPALANLKVLEDEAGAREKVGVFDQWLNVRDPNGMRGYIAAWYVENAPVPESASKSSTFEPSTPTPESPEMPPSTPEPDPASPTTPQRSRKSVADGLENVELVPSADQLFDIPSNAPTLVRQVGNIWNRYGGLLQALSKRLGIGPGVAVAVLSIESGGQAFSSDGRMVIRFENHIFYQYWGKTNTGPFGRHFRYNAGQSWTGHQWRPTTAQNWIDCHTSQTSEWDVLNFARSFDQTAAKTSISMGAPQIMGFNYSVIGYASADDMFAAFSTSERDQIIGFFDFVAGILPDGGAIKALQQLDYKAFATTYNGSGQADYYAGLMKTAHEAFKALKSTSTPTQTPTPPVDSDPPTDPSLSPTDEEENYDETQETEETEEKERVHVIVGANVARPGLNLHRRPKADSPVITVKMIGARLRVLGNPDKVRPLIGQPNHWLQVKDRKGRRGFVLALYVVEDKEEPNDSTEGLTPS